MAATGHDGNGHGADGESGRGGDCSFVWDDASQLYYHASSGFYHDPKAGWYYSTRDGLYYRYVDGQYLLWKSDEGGDNCELVDAVSDTGIQGQSAGNVCFADDGFGDPSPPSDWLEETLINFYLRGYSTEEANACSSTFGTGDGHDASGRLLSDRTSSDSVYGDPHSDKLNEIEQDKTIAEDAVEPAETSEAEDNLRYEENWLAQYGQVVKPEDEILLPFPVVDIWDWRLVEESGKKTNHVSRLVGKLVKQSMKLHPSVPAGGGILKTARICEVHLDLVRAATGKIYRLRSPSTEYLSTLLTYDSSNPTKDWPFPKLDIESLLTCTTNVNDPTGASTSVLRCKGSSAGSRQPDSAFGKNIMPGIVVPLPYNPLYNLVVFMTEHGFMDNENSMERSMDSWTMRRHHPEYRDRAAERRALHGSSGIAPGKKLFSNDNINTGDAFSESSYTAETAIETVYIPFGAQSFGRRVLESMGWKEAGLCNLMLLLHSLLMCHLAVSCSAVILLFVWEAWGP